METQLNIFGILSQDKSPSSIISQPSAPECKLDMFIRVSIDIC